MGDAPVAPKTPPMATTELSAANSSTPLPKSPVNTLTDRMATLSTPRKTEATTANGNGIGSTTMPNICLHIELKPEADEITPNVVMDFLKQAEEQYGFEKLHPDTRTAQDLLNDDDDGVDDDENEDIDLMGETNGLPSTSSNNATSNNSTVPSKRGRIEGKYDLHDPFIDDSELLWEEQAASTKDGFFVYSGPLVQEGEQPQIERADGSIKKNKEGQTTTGAKKGPRKKKDDSSAGSGTASTTATKRPKATKQGSTEKDGPSKKKVKSSTGTEKKEKSSKKVTGEVKPKKEKKESAKMKQTKLTSEKPATTKSKPTTNEDGDGSVAVQASPTSPNMIIGQNPSLIPIAPKPTTPIPAVVDLTDSPSPSQVSTPQLQARTSASIANLLI